MSYLLISRVKRAERSFEIMQLSRESEYGLKAMIYLAQLNRQMVGASTGANPDVIENAEGATPGETTVHMSTCCH